MQNDKIRILLIPVLFAAALLLAVCACFSGCYTITQGATMLGYLGKAVPLESLLEQAPQSEKAAHDAAEAEKNRLFVQRVQDIRGFAMNELGLKMSKNYTRYVQIDRDYLAAIVSACAPDSFTGYEWKFPVVGAMPYKGFFNVKDAYTERKKLEKKGLDVWIRSTDAFSTLGWFRDPLYSYMRDYSDYQLADLIIHELTHATVFIKGQMQFNEELAEITGREGARLYIESRFGIESPEYREIDKSESDSRAYISFLLELADKLETMYSGAMDRDEKLREKEQIINDAKMRFNEEYGSRFSSDNYRGFADLPVNNAYLQLYRLYYQGGDFLTELYEKSGKDLPAFINAAKTLVKKDNSGLRDPKERLAKALGL
ncbi:MAG: aminopeptidase [Treponema sp.]|nr:aminopeptidase [Treponema sp.]